MTYTPYSDLWMKLSESSPAVTGMIELIAPFLSQSTGMDLMPWLNILRFNRQDRPFYNVDSGLTLGMRNNFRELTSMPYSTTNAQSVGRSLASYFIDDKGLAEQALQRTANFYGGGTYAFGTGGQSIADITGGWNTQTMGQFGNRLTGMMADVWNMSFDPNVTKGQRNMLLSGVLQSNPELLQQYGEARKLANELGIEWKNDWRSMRDNINEGGPNGPVADKFQKLIDSLEKAQKSIELFGEAANNWGKVLKTDAVNAMERVQSLIGGSAFASFQGNEDALNRMALGIKHVGGVSGRGMDNAMAFVSQAGQYLMRTGGPADAAVNVGTTAMLQSSGMAGYRVTQEMADKMMLQFNADLQRSDAASIYFGGFQRYVENQMREGRSDVNIQTLEREWQGLVRKNGLTVSGVNNALGENMTLGELGLNAKMNWASDARTGPNGFAMIAMQDMQESVMGRLLASGGVRNDDGTAMTWQDIQDLSKDIGTDVFSLINNNATVFNQKLQGLSQEQRERVLNFRQQTEQVFNQMAVNTPGELGAFATQGYNAFMRAMDPRTRERYEILQQQANIRSDISSGIAGGSIFQSIANLVRTNPNFSLGDILAAAGSEDLSGEALDVIHSLDLSEEDRRRFTENLQETYGEGTGIDKAFLQHQIDLFSKAVAQDPNDPRTVRAAAKRYLRPFGLSVDLRGNVTVSGIDEDTKKEYTKARNEWAALSGEKTKLAESLSGKDATKMTIDEKIDVAGRMAMLDIATERVEMGTDATGAYAEYRKAVEDFNKADKEDKAKFREIVDQKYAALQELKDEGFEEKRAKNLSAMGVSADHSGLAIILDQLLKGLYNTFKTDFGSGGNNKLQIQD